MKEKVTAKDAGFATIFIISMVMLIILITNNIQLEALNPIEKVFSDFKITDIYFSQIKESSEVSNDIVIVNIGTLNRAGIAALVNVINKYDPAVIGIDAFFKEPRNPNNDAELENAFAHTKNLVLVSELKENPDGSKIDSISYSIPRFAKYSTPGFADMLTKGKFEFKIARECIPQEIFKGKPVYSFPVQLVRKYAPKAAKDFIDRENEVEEINFQGNILLHHNDEQSNTKPVFYVLDWEQVLNEAFEPELIRNKIVMMGFTGNKLGDPSWVDKFYTPLNKNYLGKTNPDMFGVVVHANVVAMILNRDYINTLPKALNYLFSLVFIYLNVWFFGWMYKNLNEWWDGASMIVELLEVLVLMSIAIAIFHLFNYKIEITLPMVALFLMGNLDEIYFGIILPSIKKFFTKKNSPSKPFSKTNKQTFINHEI